MIGGILLVCLLVSQEFVVVVIGFRFVFIVDVGRYLFVFCVWCRCWLYVLLVLWLFT